MKKKSVQMFLAAVALLMSIMYIPQAQSQTWTAMTSGTTNALYDVWGTSGSAVYAVGAAGTILFYNGSSWSTSTSGTTETLSAVWGSSLNDVFVAGSNGTMLHHNGSSIAQMTLPGGYETVNYTGLWGSSGSDVFAVGGNVIVHYDGSSWSAMTSGTTNTLFSVWGASGSDVFAVGSNIILHYNGSTWGAMTNPESGNLFAVWGSSGTDVYAVGYNSSTSGVITIHYDGASWSTISTTASGRLSGVWGSSGTDVFVVGYTGMITHYNGTWSNMTSNTSQELYAVWGSSGSDVFAAGNNGTILHYTTGSSTTTTTIDSSTTTSIDFGTTTTTTIRRLCPFRHSSVRESNVQPLRSLRDSQLDTAFGAVIASMYYQNMDEITGILLDSPLLRSRFNRLTRINMTAVRELMTQGTATIDAADLLEMHDFLTDLQGRAGLKLRMDTDFILRGLESGWLLQWLGVVVE